MVKSRKEFPAEGDLVIATVTKIANHGAYVTLDEYEGKEGLVHISEVSQSWVRNIRNFLKEGQKVVAKVLRTDIRKGFIDLSLRRVTEHQKKEKVQEWKRAQKAENLLELAAKKLGKALDEAYEKVGWPLEDKYGEIYAGLEKASEKGEQILLEAGISEEWSKVVAELAKAYVEIPKVRIKGVLELTCWRRNGVEAIKKALIAAEETVKDGDACVEIYTVGAPRYRVEVIAKDYKQAENIMREAVNMALTIIKEEGGSGTFIREK
ncbi:MAG: translation initiation factor IF-2 subunit alpha [Candidatus Freyarchaeota archaeon]|nr:translation initiation factor IF-2 subunit alpha [Candidatus Jordarchaeia archaeon]